MIECKAAVIVHMRTLLQAKGDKTDNAFLAKLTPEEKCVYQSAQRDTQVPIAMASRLYQLAVPLIYTGCDLQYGLRQLGSDTAQNDLQGIYKALLRLVTPAMAIQQTAKIWKKYYPIGTAAAEKCGPHKALLKIRDFPELPESLRELLQGYISGVLALTGMKTIKIIRNDSNPNEWQWHVEWNSTC